MIDRGNTYHNAVGQGMPHRNHKATCRILHSSSLFPFKGIGSPSSVMYPTNRTNFHLWSSVQVFVMKT